MISKESCDFLMNYVDQEALKNAGTDIQTIVKNCFGKVNIDEPNDALHLYKKRHIKLMKKVHDNEIAMFLKRMRDEQTESNTETENIGKSGANQTKSKSSKYAASEAWDEPKDKDKIKTWRKTLSSWNKSNNFRANRNDNKLIDRSKIRQCNRCKFDDFPRLTDQDYGKSHEKEMLDKFKIISPDFMRKNFNRDF